MAQSKFTLYKYVRGPDLPAIRLITLMTGAQLRRSYSLVVPASLCPGARCTA